MTFISHYFNYFTEIHKILNLHTFNTCPPRPFPWLATASQSQPTEGTQQFFLTVFKQQPQFLQKSFRYIYILNIYIYWGGAQKT